MSFIETLENIDRTILLGINGSHHPLLDQVMFYTSEKWIMIPVYLLLIYFLQKIYGWKTTGVVLLMAVALVAVCDLTATHLFKNVVMRYRPTHNLDIKDQLHIVNGYRGGEFGFYSSHASNMTALAVFCGYFLYGKIKHYATIAFALVFLICFSRVYLGVHYPSDVLTGIFAGGLLALIFVFIFYRFLRPQLNFQS